MNFVRDFSISKDQVEDLRYLGKNLYCALAVQALPQSLVQLLIRYYLFRRLYNRSLCSCFLLFYLLLVLSSFRLTDTLLAALPPFLPTLIDSLLPLDQTLLVLLA